MKRNCEVCETLEDSSGEILTTEYWRVALGPDQGYLGRSYVTLLDHKGSLSEMSHEEWQDYEQLNKRLEQGYQRILGATIINWGCLMNNAFQVEPAEPHVHWHLRPRYDKPVEVNGEVFTDPDFGFHYDRQHQKIVSSETFNVILHKLIEGLTE